uniref:Uncharacterized protein n=1 Tax=Babesia bovis TaxID=5865 RepID=S6BLM2_BABBO|nr:hypothetical protein [Babesia bovis]
MSMVSPKVLLSSLLSIGSSMCSLFFNSFLLLAFTKCCNIASTSFMVCVRLALNSLASLSNLYSAFSLFGSSRST